MTGDERRRRLTRLLAGAGAAWGLILLLIAVFPANIYMAGWREEMGLTVSPLLLWLRLPLQFLLIAWVWDVGIRRNAALGRLEPARASTLF